MKNLQLAVLAAASVLAMSQAANASIVTLNFSGTYDSLGDIPAGSNQLAGLLGTQYSESASFSTDSYLLLRTEVDVSEVPIQTKAWFYNTQSTLQTVAGGYNHTNGGVVLELINNFVYDGSQGVLAAGTYDILDITAWLRGSGPVVNPAACPHPTGGSLLGESVPGPCSLAGTNYAVDLQLIGTAGFFSSFAGFPLAELDYSQVVYGSAGLRQFVDGVNTGEISQDPPLTYHDGVLSGVGFGVTIEESATPEPASWALMIGGLGMVGAALRRRTTVTA